MIKFKSIRGRLIFYFTLVILSTLILSAVTATTFIRLRMRRDAVIELNRQADIVATQYRNGNILKPNLLRVMEKALQTKIIHLRVPNDVLPRNRRRLRNNKETERNLRIESSLNWRRLANGRRQIINADIPDTKTPAILIVQPLISQGRLMGAVILAKPLKYYRLAWMPVTEQIFLAGLITLIIALILAAYLARRLARPINEITASAEEIAKGNTEQKVTVDSQDELGKLAQSFNYMAVEVSNSVKLRQNFIMNVSHELKTPLTSIQGFTEALLDKAIADPLEERAALNVIHRESLHLARLINDLLDLAKLDAKQFSLKKESANINSLLNDCRLLYAERAKLKSIDFTADLATLPDIHTDGGRLKQIIINLLENAVKFTPSGGKINLKGRAEPGHLLIEVSDTGSGIKPDELPNIFKPFYTSRKSQGSGLGLAIANELSKALGGRLSVATQTGKGTTFKISLPINS